MVANTGEHPGGGRLTRFELRELFRIGRASLAVGLAMLCLCIVLGAEFSSRVGETYASRFLGEGLIILGWVANWRPIQIFLYDWWPLARRRALYARLARATVEVREAGASSKHKVGSPDRSTS